MKPTKEELIAHLKTGIGNICLCCGNRLTGSWTDLHGQYQCHDCGMTYQFHGCHLTEEFLRKNGLDKKDIAERYCDEFELVPLAQEYYRETGNKVPFGTFFSTPRDFREQSESFYRWLAGNADRFEAEYAEDFNWSALKETFANTQSYAI